MVETALLITADVASIAALPLLLLWFICKLKK